MFPGDEQFATLLLYLDNICIFAVYIKKCWTAMRLFLQGGKNFNLKIKPKHFTSFSTVLIFWDACYQ